MFTPLKVGSLPLLLLALTACSTVETGPYSDAFLAYQPNKNSVYMPVSKTTNQARYSDYEKVQQHRLLLKKPSAARIIQ